MIHAGGDTGMWDEEDGFFYDVLRLPDGRAERLKVRSMVGLLPLCAVTVFDGQARRGSTRSCGERFARFLEARPELTRVHPRPGASRAWRAGGSASILDETKLRRVLATMLDENEFLSPYGIRSLSRYHAEHPYVFHVGGQEYRVAYLPAESDTRHVRRQLQLARADLDAGQRPDHPRAAAVLHLLRRRLHDRMPDRLRAADDPVPGGRGDQRAGWPASSCATTKGRRPVYGGTRKFQEDPHWRDLHPVLRVLPRRQRRRARRQPPDRLDRRHRPAHAPVRDHARPSSSSSSARRPASRKWSRRRRRPPASAAPVEALTCHEPALPVALPDQHARLADRAVARRWAGRPRWTTSPTPSSTALAAMGFDWVWLLSVWQTGPAGQRVSRDEPRVAAGVRGDAARPARGGHRRLRLRDHRLHRASRPGRRRGAGPAARAAARSAACG